MARAVVLLTPISSPRPWWLVSGGQGIRGAWVVGAMLVPRGAAIPGGFQFGSSWFLFPPLSSSSKKGHTQVTVGPEQEGAVPRAHSHGKCSLGRW